MARYFCLLLVCLSVAGEARAQNTGFDTEVVERLAQLALDCVHREFPNKISHVLNGDEDVAPPRKLFPVFYGCYDWHSSVHGHWMLVRLARLFPDAAFQPGAMAALSESFVDDKVAGELAYFEGSGRTSFERPYGLAWFLQLMSELREWDHEDARRWLGILEPLETVIAERLRVWLPKLSHPIRGGEHFQTAFAFGLIYDWSVTAGDAAMSQLIRERASAYYAGDVNCPLDYEPSGHDFLSSCWAEADLMRRLMNAKSFSKWLSKFIPKIPAHYSGAWFGPVTVSDPSDPKLAHLDGLNLSRSWMLDGVASALPSKDKRRMWLQQAAAVHRAAGLTQVSGEHYEGGHWLASFATYSVTRRGVQKDR
ncbi:MAG: DUF2891 domain-containing protein [Gammaproteobacteria bacterium]|nr:DUF2891 domain-containing protein [Gammaproteobacteria bacterium]